MIIVMKPDAAESSIQTIVEYIKGAGLQVHLSKGEELTIIGVVGDKSKLATENLLSFRGVDRIVPVTETYKLANRKFHPEPTIVHAGKITIGPDTFTVMAGPCAVESEEQLLTIAKAVKNAGATMLRGGAYKPRTSPYSFQGLEEEGLKYLQEAGTETGLATVTEVISAEAIEAAARYVDMLQIGARNMQNYDLLRALGRVKKPVLLKRGSGATLRELLLSAEYILSGGNENVILCERGIRTFSDGTRSTLDLSAVPLLHEMTHLPVVVDPSHAVGRASLVPPMALAAAACGADGLLIEVHNDPLHALCDGAQALLPEDFAALARQIAALREVTHR